MKKPNPTSVITGAYATLGIERHSFINDARASALDLGLLRFVSASFERQVDETVVRLSNPLVAGSLAERQPLTIGSLKQAGSHGTKTSGALGTRLGNALESVAILSSGTDALPLRGLTAGGFAAMQSFPNLGGVSSLELAIIRQADIATNGFAGFKPTVQAAPQPLKTQEAQTLSPKERNDILRRVRRLLRDDTFVLEIGKVADRYGAKLSPAATERPLAPRPARKNDPKP